MLEAISVEAFLPLIGCAFAFRFGDQELFVTLQAAGEIGGYRGSELRAPFRLEFIGPMTPVWSQGIHRVVGEGIPDLDIFFVPIGPNADGMRYEAIFN